MPPLPAFHFHRGLNGLPDGTSCRFRRRIKLIVHSSSFVIERCVPLCDLGHDACSHKVLYRRPALTCGFLPLDLNEFFSFYCSDSTLMLRIVVEEVMVGYVK